MKTYPRIVRTDSEQQNDSSMSGLEKEAALIDTKWTLRDSLLVVVSIFLILGFPAFPIAFFIFFPIVFLMVKIFPKCFPGLTQLKKTERYSEEHSEEIVKKQIEDIKETVEAAFPDTIRLSIELAKLNFEIEDLEQKEQNKDGTVSVKLIEARQKYKQLEQQYLIAQADLDKNIVRLPTKDRTDIL